MSDREFSGFDVATLTEAVRQPPLDQLRSRARSRRHRSVAVLATALVALAGVAVVPSLAKPERTDLAGPERTDPARPQRTDPAGPPKPSPGPAGSSDFTLTGPDSGVDVRRNGCVLNFSYTGDRGRSWSDWDAARFEGARCQASSLSPERVLYFSVLSDRSYLVSDAGTLRLSIDYGRTWRNGDEAIVAVATIPVTARPVFCAFGCGALREPLAVDPSSGTVYRLAGSPPSPLPLFSLYASPDGTIWATYRTNLMEIGTSATAVARSADRGRSWTTWELGPDSNALTVVGLDDREGYLLAEPTAVEPSMRLLRTTDGGKSWTNTGANLPTSSHWDLTVGSDGSLLAITPAEGTDPDRLARLLVSRDDGRHFTVVREYGPVVGAASVAPGYAWLFGRDGSTGEPDHFLLTTDATTWTRFTLSP
ncbi:WD40/YVTN/BNR-like repeat-containing protein [Micromonospora vulcania]|uniref:WD40/YVTN/BNR-like repeat-containing protein n=1 Tax=Micromonospora vulcania TaxID=1441873 RepID=A0ABW1H9B3_9ACTN